MLDFVRDYTRPDGLAPLIGDADDGRFLPLGDYGADPRDHRHLFAQAGRPYEPATESAAYPDGGYYVLRSRRPLRDRALRRRRALRPGRPRPQRPALVRARRGRPAARDRPRELRLHVRPGGAEPVPLDRVPLDAATRRRRAERAADATTSSRWTTGRRPRRTAWDGTSFEGRHHGFPGATHTRRIELVDDGLLIRDTISSPVAHEVEWTFPLAPGAESQVEIRAEGLDFRPEDGWYSPRYGVRESTTFLRARRRSRAGEDVTEIRVRAIG